jgi:predicted methyltransferase
MQLPTYRARTARCLSALAAAATMLLAGCASTSPSASTAAPLGAAQIDTVIASPDRRAADRTNDVRRKPAQMLAFIGARPGMTALDHSAGGGNTSELLARAAGPNGRVYAQVAPRAGGAPPSFATRSERAKTLGSGNIVPVLLPYDDLVAAEIPAKTLDVATLMFNYHDLAGMGVDRNAMNRSVFNALKPGGVYVIADHAGRPGTGNTESSTLHRIEADFVKREVQSAGFKLAAEGDFLRNPADPRDRETPEGGQPKDEFVLKFVKP